MLKEHAITPPRFVLFAEHSAGINAHTVSFLIHGSYHEQREEFSLSAMIKPNVANTTRI